MTKTAKALGGEHAERTSRGRFRLSTAAPYREGKRRFLGRETPCVGRQREMAALHALADECFEEPVARAVIAVGEAGLGKSRIRYEFLKELRREQPNLQILFGRADALSAGSPFGPLRSALRRSAGDHGGRTCCRQSGQTDGPGPGGSRLDSPGVGGRAFPRRARQRTLRTTVTARPCERLVRNPLCSAMPSEARGWTSSKVRARAGPSQSCSKTCIGGTAPQYP